MIRIKQATALFCLCCTFGFLKAQQAERKLVIVTFDGYRWKDVFRGADSALFFPSLHGSKDSSLLAETFWAPTPAERRQKLMPFFWKVIAKQGQVYGDRDVRSLDNVTNPYWFSYPGYNEIFTGYADTAINSNDYPANPNVTLQEYLNRQPAFNGKIAAFASWVAFERILNKERSGIPVNAGYTAFTGPGLTAAQAALSQEQFLLPKPFGIHERPDAITYQLAREYLRQEHPRVLQISFIETDAFGHQDKYDSYLQSARNDDAMLEDLWDYLQSDPYYRDQTTLYIATDHGRGDHANWTHHNSKTPGSDQIWCAIMGPYTAPLGEVRNVQVWQKQYARTMAALLGVDFPGTASHPAGPPIETAIRTNPGSASGTRGAQQTSNDGAKERQYLVGALVRIADPVLENLSKGELHHRMPIEAADMSKRSYSTHLEAFGRLLAGMAPWLELGPDASPEGQLRKKYIDLAVASIKNAVDPASPDFMNFCQGRQPLVDAAFFAQALLRAPVQLWGRLDTTTKKRTLDALRSSRVITPSYTNWLMFSATIEAALLRYGGECDKMRLDYAIRQFMSWYKGDGAYGDGPEFHWDYYNSFVIQPMLLETLQVLQQADPKNKDNQFYDDVFKRSQRYAAVQERMVSPEATYPPIGRSLAYRFGVFHLLAKMALLHALPKELAPQQVRAALYAVIHKSLEAPGTFDSQGWLRIGLYGHQPGIGESYISTGSLYLCSEAFLPLGLPPGDPFWQGPDQHWTSWKIWHGEDIHTDHAL
ncbi:MAG TPA: DUF2264 domain-containing protein [Puia sp.]|nr:DUF2264 domain-containing protein [Puia sp.]